VVRVGARLVLFWQRSSATHDLHPTAMRASAIEWATGH
jgi:hypothetical protein